MVSMMHGLKQPWISAPHDDHACLLACANKATSVWHGRSLMEWNGLISTFSTEVEKRKSRTAPRMKGNVSRDGIIDHRRAVGEKFDVISKNTLSKENPPRLPTSLIARAQHHFLTGVVGSVPLCESPRLLQWTTPTDQMRFARGRQQEARQHTGN
ncbi:hypothetical protein PDE_08902 [Penicillium oxalicum 114-2]|uniref:Uncharacterized protein n=1 Tax=Penicillium oxalicum (strain 114-2 / CGMCC 5302) TaxID=933388 RepID=S7ZTB0_PENO1|nr:hypothetical protein PDE_08902 [Penicillium oxalicum 114-2]